MVYFLSSCHILPKGIFLIDLVLNQVMSTLHLVIKQLGCQSVVVVDAFSLRVITPIEPRVLTLFFSGSVLSDVDLVFCSVCVMALESPLQKGRLREDDQNVKDNERPQGVFTR